MDENQLWPWEDEEFDPISQMEEESVFPDAEFEAIGYTPPDIVLPMELTDTMFHYRSPGDDINVIRVNYKDPKGCVRVAKNIAVAGVTFRLDSATRFVFGKQQYLRLVPEPDNKYDPNAIKVMGHYWSKETSEWKEEHVGYIPKKLAATLGEIESFTASISNELDNRNYVVLKTMFVPHQGKSPGIRMDIWKVDDVFDAVKELDQKMSDEWPDGPSALNLAMDIVKGNALLLNLYGSSQE